MSHRRRAQQKAASPKKGLPKAAIIGGVVLLAAIVILVAKGAKSAGDAPAAAVPGAASQPPATAAAKPAPAEAIATAASSGTAEAQLGRLLAAGQPVLGFYHSTNCAKCKEMMAIVTEVYPEFESTVGLVDVDVYAKTNTKLLQVARIYAIPTQIFYHKSGQQETVLGVMTAEALREKLRFLAAEQ